MTVCRDLFGEESRVNQDLPINPVVSIRSQMKVDQDGDYEFSFNFTEKDKSDETIVIYVRIDVHGEIAWVTADGNCVPCWHDMAQWTVDSALIDYEECSNKVREKAIEFLNDMSKQGYEYRRIDNTGIFYRRDKPELKDKVDKMKTSADALNVCDAVIKM